MTKWEKLEDYLFQSFFDGQEFTNRDIAEHFGVSPHEGSRMIQAYLDAQTTESVDTLFVLTRRGRTTSAVWHAGAATQDARDLYRQTVEDLNRRVERFVIGTLRHMGVRNPRAIPATSSLVKILEGVVEIAAAGAGESFAA